MSVPEGREGHREGESEKGDQTNRWTNLHVIQKVEVGFMRRRHEIRHHETER